MSKQKSKFLSIDEKKIDIIVYEMGVPDNIKTRYYPTFEKWNQKVIKMESVYKYHYNFMQKAGLSMVGSSQWIENINHYYIVDEKKASVFLLKHNI